MCARRWTALPCGFVIAAALSGCATREPIYYWGNYQPSVWAYFKPDESAAQEQQAEMEETAQKAQSKGKPLPPGFQAHLGLLYLKNGETQKAQAAFLAEETQFPESKPYMSFLMKNLAPQQQAHAVTPPLAPPPETAATPSMTPTSAPASSEIAP